MQLSGLTALAPSTNAVATFPELFLETPMVGTYNITFTETIRGWQYVHSIEVSEGLVVSLCFQTQPGGIARFDNGLLYQLNAYGNFTGEQQPVVVRLDVAGNVVKDSYKDERCNITILKVFSPCPQRCTVGCEDLLGWRALSFGDTAHFLFGGTRLFGEGGQNSEWATVRIDVRGFMSLRSGQRTSDWG